MQTSLAVQKKKKKKKMQSCFILLFIISRAADEGRRRFDQSTFAHAIGRKSCYDDRGTFESIWPSNTFWCCSTVSEGVQIVAHKPKCFINFLQLRMCTFIFNQFEVIAAQNKRCKMGSSTSQALRLSYMQSNPPSRSLDVSATFNEQFFFKLADNQFK